MAEIVYGNYKGFDGMVLRRSIQIKEKHIFRLLQTNADLKKQYAEKLENIKELNQTIRDSQKMLHINAQIEPMLDKLECQLKQTEWLGNTTYSLADVVWTATLHHLEQLKFADLWEKENRPAIADYFQSLKTRPNFKTAIENDVIPLPIILAGLRRIFLGFDRAS